MRFVRDLERGVVGADVEAAKRAVYRALGRSDAWAKLVAAPVSQRRTFGRFFEQHVRDFQRSRRLRVDGVIGPETLRRLSEAKRKGSQEPAFDAFAARLWGWQVERLLGDVLVRERIVAAARRLWLRASEISYSQFRPMAFQPAPAVPRWLDCSAFVTHAFREAGAPDPNGYRPEYPGWGYTGTLWKTGRSVAVRDLRPADLVFYGSPWLTGGAAHVVLYRGGGSVFSMGSSSGPRVEAWNYRPVVGCRTYRLK